MIGISRRARIISRRTGRKAIVLLTDGQDSGLGPHLGRVQRAPREGAARVAGSRSTMWRANSGADGIALFLVSTGKTARSMTPAWLEAHQTGMLVNKNSRREGMPTRRYNLAELARRVGGQLYFLREIGNLAHNLSPRPDD